MKRLMSILLCACACASAATAGGSVREDWIQAYDASTRAWRTLSRGALTPALKLTWDSTTSTISAASGVRFEVSGLRDRQMYWCDEFMEYPAVLASTVVTKAYWSGAGTNGTQTVTAGANGLMVLATSGTASSSSSLSFRAANFPLANAPVLETMFKVNGVTTTEVKVGWYQDADDYCYVEFDTTDSATKIYVRHCKNGGSEVSVDSGVTMSAGTYYTVRFELLADGGYKAYINGVLVRQAAAGSLTSNSLVPYFSINNKTTAVDRQLTIDYVKLWQNR